MALRNKLQKLRTAARCFLLGHAWFELAKHSSLKSVPQYCNRCSHRRDGEKGGEVD